MMTVMAMWQWRQSLKHEESLQTTEPREYEVHEEMEEGGFWITIKPERCYVNKDGGENFYTTRQYPYLHSSVPRRPPLLLRFFLIGIINENNNEPRGENCKDAEHCPPELCEVHDQVHSRTDDMNQTG